MRGEFPLSAQRRNKRAHTLIMILSVMNPMGKRFVCVANGESHDELEKWRGEPDVSKIHRKKLKGAMRTVSQWT